MLLQTLVQLNILIFATPALAGCHLLPLVQPGVARTVCVALQSRTAEAVAPKTAPNRAVQALHAVRPQPIVLARLAAPAAVQDTTPAPAFSVPTSAAVVSFHPFPHAARAP